MQDSPGLQSPPATKARSSAGAGLQKTQGVFWGAPHASPLRAHPVASKAGKYCHPVTGEHGAWDRLSVALLVLAGAVALLTFSDYGLSWDDYTHAQYGDLLLDLYRSGLRDRRALSWVNLYYYGGGFDLLSAAAAKILPLPLFDTRRLMGAVVGIIGLFATWRTGRRIAGPLAGFVALALLCACPAYWGNMFMNPKDAPFAVAMAVLLLMLVRALEQYPRPSLPTAALVGAAFGIAFGTRILGAFAVLEFLAALLFIFLLEGHGQGVAAAATRLLRFLVALLPALVPAYLVMALVWPWSVLDPLNPLWAVEYFSRFFEKPWWELFRGSLIRVTHMPRSYLPTLFALKLPELFSALAFAGVLAVPVMLCRRDILPARRGILLLVVLAALLPPAVAVALKPAMYNGIRHFVFVLPPMAILGGLAVAWLCDRLRRFALVPAAAVIALTAGLALPVAEMIRLHPYEYSYFNTLYGGVQRAQGSYMLDYWGLSFKQASQALAAKLAESGEPKPSGRPWKLAVCGPQRSPQVELGPDFATSWDPADADFAMMLGEFYCRKFDAPLVAEIVRDGITYARVYDIRGRSYDSLLTVPGV